MTRIAILATLLLVASAASADDAAPESVGAWSAATNGLRARLVAKDLWVNDGTTTLGVYLELDNVSDVGSPMVIRWSDRCASYSLADAAGKPVAESHLPRGGPQALVDQLVVPHDGKLRFRVSVTGVMLPKNQRWLIALPNQDWVVARGAKGPLKLAAKITVPKPGGTSHDWSGEIAIPPVALTP